MHQLRHELESQGGGAPKLRCGRFFLVLPHQQIGDQHLMSESFIQFLVATKQVSLMGRLQDKQFVPQGMGSCFFPGVSLLGEARGKVGTCISTILKLWTFRVQEQPSVCGITFHSGYAGIFFCL